MLTIDLTGRQALVTGAGRGIGRGIAEILLEAGAKVILSDMQEYIITDLIDRYGKDAVSFAMLDVTDSQAVQQLIDTEAKEGRDINILVNNAGISTMDYVVDIKESDWDKVLEVNAKGTFLCSQAVAKNLLKKNKRGKIVNIASQAGKNGYRCMGNYCSSKHAVLGLTKVMAVELANKDILVNAVCPGIVETEMKHKEREIGGSLRGMTAAQIEQEDNSQVPMGRTADIRDVANVALFLASELSDYMTGQAINVTGGMTMN